MDIENLSHQKIIETVQKSSSLLAEKKYYEFAQKITLLSHRKMQTNKLDEAELLIKLGIQKLSLEKESQINILNDLIDKLLTLYEKNKDLWKSQTTQNIHRLLTLRENPNRIQYYLKIIKTIIPISKAQKIAEDLISYYEEKQDFSKAQFYVVKLQLDRVLKFLAKWKKILNDDDYLIVICRLALLKGLFADFDETMVLLSDVPPSHSFYKFAKFLVQSVQMKSKQCYEKIGQSYAKFLQKDIVFELIYRQYGAKFFNIKKQEGGLGNLIGFLDD